MLRLCSKCNKNKSISEFRHSLKRVYCVCKECSNPSLSKRIKLAKKGLIECYRCRQIKSLKEFSQVSLFTNKAKVCLKCKLANQKEIQKRFRLKNKEKLNLKSRKRNLTPKQRIYWKNYIYNRRQNDINFRILHNLRVRVKDAIKNNSKNSHTVILLGCSIPLVRKYLESKFQPNMTWENYGKWHIDHIIPCSNFDLSKEENQRKCFHYSNLQPLWAKDNLKKGNRTNTIS